MIIGKFLDPRAPSLPKQVGINTDDIAEILQENEEQSANIQQNTDDIELLKQQVSESGTRVRVDGELVAEWSPDELTDDLQQLRLAQSSDSLAIVSLQSDNITNKQNIAKLDAETLKTPFSPPANIELVGIGINNSQVGIPVGDGLKIENNIIGVKRKYVTLSLNSQLTANWNTLSVVEFDAVNNQASDYFNVSNGQITVLKDCKIRATGNVRASGNLGISNRFIVGTASGGEFCGQQNSRANQINSAYELLSATSSIVTVGAGQIIYLKYQNNYNGNSDVGKAYTNLCVEVIE